MTINNIEKIIEVTFLLSLKNGFDRVSIKQIQEESGLAAGSIYYHFKDKNEILEHMVNKYLLGNFEEFKGAIRNYKGSFKEKINFIFYYKTKSFNQEKIHANSPTLPDFNYKDYYILLMSIYHQYPQVRHLFHEMHDDLWEFYNELLQEAIENEEIRGDIDVKSLNIFIETSLKGYIDLWLNQPNLLFDEIVETNVNLIWEAIKKQ